MLQTGVSHLEEMETNEEEDDKEDIIVPEEIGDDDADDVENEEKEAFNYSSQEEMTIDESLIND